LLSILISLLAGSCIGAGCIYWWGALLNIYVNMITYGGASLVLGGILNFGSIYAATKRPMIQRALGAPEESCCASWLTHAWCACCALTQEARAIDEFVIDQVAYTAYTSAMGR
jgi:Cys-rich protein (TIGR01571 family)